MNLKNVLCRRALREISKYNRQASYMQQAHFHTVRKSAAIAPSRREIHSPAAAEKFAGSWVSARWAHTFTETHLQEDESEGEVEESEEDAAMNDFLSRFVWIMRRKLAEAFPETDKSTIDGMLMIIVEKVVLEMEKSGLGERIDEGSVASSGDDMSPDLWRTVWEVSNVVLEDMREAQKKEKMKNFLQSEEVKEMSRFAGEIGIRGDMLRELRFKWAREKMEESEFYESLEKLRKEETKDQDQLLIEGSVEAEDEEGLESRAVSLPKRHGKLKYKIYGLDLSDKKWADVADKVHESGKVIWPQEAKPITGKCKIVTEKIVSLRVEDDPAALLAEWKELLQPSRVDWSALLDRLKERDTGLYLKIAELVLAEESFETDIRDYSKLIEAHSALNQFQDAERILQKMKETGTSPDILTLNMLVRMYTKSGNIKEAEEAFKNLKSQGCRPDMKLYKSMIMAYVKADQPKKGEELLRNMELTRDLKPTEDIYKALLRGFSACGDVEKAKRVASSMEFTDGVELDVEYFTLLIEAYGPNHHSYEEPWERFKHMMRLGIKPDDRCTASMLAHYERHNALERALDLLMQLKKDGFEPGILTHSVMLDWMCKLLLVDEAEAILGLISELGEAPPVKVHVALCEMYSRAKIEKKALQTVAVLESKKNLLRAMDFERVIKGLLDGGFYKDAERMRGVMEAQGLEVSVDLNVSMISSKPTVKPRLRL